MYTMKTRRVFRPSDMKSGDGMLTTVWGPPLWHVLHTMSFNYPVEPTQEQKHQYRDFILQLEHVLPCKYCRLNLKKNLKAVPLTMKEMESRDTFSRFVYRLHEHINKMLGKKSGLSYCDVRERYEHFRARCTTAPLPTTEKGCTEPVVQGKKAKSVINIVPVETQCETIQIAKECLKTRLN
jgi:hypothetical protein